MMCLLFVIIADSDVFTVACFTFLIVAFHMSGLLFMTFMSNFCHFLLTSEAVTGCMKSMVIQTEYSKENLVHNCKVTSSTNDEA